MVVIFLILIILSTKNTASINNTNQINNNGLFILLHYYSITFKMSHNQFSSTGFPTKSTISEQRIRNIIKDQVFDILLTIKDEIQNKVKLIDKCIIQLRDKINAVQHKQDKLSTHRQEQSSQKLIEIQNRLEQVQKKVSTLQIMQNQIKQFQQNSLYSRNRSMQKIPILKKANNSVNLSKILFGDDNQYSAQNIEISPIKPSNNQIFSKKQSPKNCQNTINQKIKGQKTKMNSKPPLPVLKGQNKLFNDSRIKSQPSINFLQEQKFEQYNPQSNQEQQQISPDKKVLQSLNKNKNIFLRKKSQQNLNSNQLNVKKTAKFESLPFQCNSKQPLVYSQQWRQTIQQEENQSSISAET